MDAVLSLEDGYSLEGGYSSFIRGWVFHWDVHTSTSLEDGYFINF